MDLAQSDAVATCRAQLFTDVEGSKTKQIAITPAIKYACRGKRLGRLCALIKVERRRETGPVEVADGGSNGRLDCRDRFTVWRVYNPS